MIDLKTSLHYDTLDKLGIFERNLERRYFKGRIGLILRKFEAREFIFRSRPTGRRGQNKYPATKKLSKIKPILKNAKATGWPLSRNKCIA